MNRTKMATMGLMTLATVAIMAVSCSKDADTKVFRATSEPATEQGKVTYSEGQLLWAEGDSISIYDAAANAAVYGITSGVGTTDAEFAMRSGANLSSSPYTAVCPADIRDGVSTINLPAVQHTPDGSLTGLPMYAVSNNMSLKFYNLCGVLRFRLSSSSTVSVSAVAVETNSNTNGSATISGSGSSVSLSTPTGTTTTTLGIATAQSISPSSVKDFYMYLPAGNYSTFVITITASTGAVCTKTALSAITVQRGAITTITLSGLNFAMPAPVGAINGKFSVSSTKQVYFSKGNLQYQASTRTWRFAEHQYSIVGSGNNNISKTNSGWIDLFGWGTSGWNSGATCYQPWSTSTHGYDYCPGGSYTNSLTGTYARADWGVYNAISNGGNVSGQWRTLTIDEWDYLFYTRSASKLNGKSNARYVKAQVNNKRGVIVFPDSYTHPSEVALPTRSCINNYSSDSDGGNYSVSDWSKMEEAGAVFLPAASHRFETGWDNFSFSWGCGKYWSSSAETTAGGYSTKAYGIYFDKLHIEGLDNRGPRLSTYERYDRSTGLSVRLVHE